ncbi:MAG: PSD1 and planctomycete cytochrome C domain-containing protein, partial [Acidobacteriota bacterium]|nr:PSD1 and planctomycete cytochrome C domain-containing protein [Acidobacteriota bacterium]
MPGRWVPRNRWVVGLGAVLLLGAAPQDQPRNPAAAGDEASAIFVKHVLPVLTEKCSRCHGQALKMSGLSVDSRVSLLRGGKRGPAVVPGSAGGSVLLAAIEQDGNLKMPPGVKLADQEVAAFRRWIELGAPWVDAAPKTTPSWNYTAQDVWEFQPLQPKAVPTEGIDRTQVQTPVDAFILAKLQEKGLRPAPRASRVKLLRRATFDLIGLPPTPAEVQAFVDDPADDQQAFAKVVDRLLASPHYGERWGRHWLDVVRYGDTGGYSNDFERPNAWRYRDYVIHSFNQDKPYDQFIREQIAGDEIDPHDPEKLVATGFLRMGPWEQTAMSVAAETRQAWLDDVTHSTATTFLGLTMECARCHDHKFDPLPTKDYYRLQAVFAATEFADRTAPFLPGEQRPDFRPGRERVARLLAMAQKKVADYEDLFRQRLVAKTGATSIDEIPRDTVAKALKSKDLLAPEEFERMKIYNKREELYSRSIHRYDALAYSVSDGPFAAKDTAKWQPQDTFILPVGNLKTPGEKVTPGVLTAVSRYNQTAYADVPETVSGRRMALADWIAGPRNPLTARVMVNRIWAWHFGRGIAGNPNNLGKMGEKPTNPELLDWLAQDFAGHGWSVKRMHRLIMLASAYQRAADPVDAKAVEKTDPENKLLSYFSPHRLEAEELRDSILDVAGQLSIDTGGPGTFPEINEDVARQPQQIMGTLMPAYRPSPTKAERNRR